jgi:hypothetical protein
MGFFVDQESEAWTQTQHVPRSENIEGTKCLEGELPQYIAP